MVRIFLAVVGIAYVLLAGWCVASPRQTSRAVGYDVQPGGGQSEYLVVYGGLQAALGLIFLWPLLRADYAMPALEACLLTHGCLVLFRTIGFFIYSGIGATTVLLAGSEWAIFLGSLLAWWLSA